MAVVASAPLAMALAAELADDQLINELIAENEALRAGWPGRRRKRRRVTSR